MIYLTDRQTYYKGWVKMIDDKNGIITIDKNTHPNFPDGGYLPPGTVLVPYRI